MLKFARTSNMPNSQFGNETEVLFGIRSQIVPLKHLFVFCISPCKYFSSPLSLLTFQNIHLIYK